MKIRGVEESDLEGISLNTEKGGDMHANSEVLRALALEGITITKEELLGTSRERPHPEDMTGWGVVGWIIYLAITLVLRFVVGLHWWIAFPVAMVVFLGVEAYKGMRRKREESGVKTRRKARDGARRGATLVNSMWTWRDGGIVWSCSDATVTRVVFDHAQVGFLFCFTERFGIIIVVRPRGYFNRIDSFSRAGLAVNWNWN